MASQQQQPGADKAMAETYTNRQFNTLKIKKKVTRKDVTKLKNEKTTLDTQAVQDRIEHEQLQQAARREVTNLRKLNKRVQRVMKETVEKDRVQATDKKLIVQLSKKLDNLRIDNKDLRDENDHLRQRTEIKLKEKRKQLTASQKNAHTQIQVAYRMKKQLTASSRFARRKIQAAHQTEIKLKEEKKQLTASEINAHEQIQAAQDFLNSAGAVLVDTTDDVKASLVRRARGNEQLYNVLHDNAVLEARVENFEEEIKNAQEALKKATAIDLS
jgi:chromosome segregation ATPase